MIEINFTDDIFTMAFGNFKFSGLFPIINDQSFPVIKPDIEMRDSSQYHLRYRLHGDEGNTFIVEISNLEDELMIQYHLEGCSDPGLIDTFGVCFEDVSGIGTFLSNGYHSWDGSVYLDEDAFGDGKQYQSYAMTQLIFEDRQDILTFGFDRHDRHQQYFIHSKTDGHRSVQAVTCWDRKNPGSCKLSSEKIRFFKSESAEAGLREWAVLIAEKAPVPPRIPQERMIGWCSWYNLYASITEENILENLSAVKKTREREKIDLKVFLIDDGFTPEMGDWFEYKPQFPNGIKPLIQAVRDAGLIPGLWIAPFLVGNRSKLFQDHPDWVVKDVLTGLPFACMKFYGEFRWHKRSEEYYLLDITYPSAAQYLTDVLSMWHKDWGVDYFKTDFLYLAAEHGPDVVSHHQAGLTRIECWRKGCALIREAVGSAFLAGCGVPLWAGVGLFDSVRIGSDMGVDWVSAESPKSPLVSIPNRNFINGILYQTDPDCVLLRDKFHNFNENEILGLLTLAGLTGGTLMTSDFIEEVSSKCLERFKWLASLDEKPSHFLNLGDLQDPLIIQIRMNAESGLVEHLFFLNSSENQIDRKIILNRLGLSPGVWLLCMDSKEEIKLNNDPFEIHLASHECRWFRVVA